MDRLLNILDARQLNWMLFGVLLLSAAALGTYVIWPRVEVARDLLSTVEVLRGVASKGGPVDKEMATLEQEVKGLGRRLHGDDMVKMSGHQLEAFIIGRMQEISWQHSVELLAVTPGTGGRIQVFEEVLFNVEVAGGYYDLYDWLIAVRDEFGIVVVKRFSILPIERQTPEPQLRATLTIVFYRESDDA